MNENEITKVIEELKKQGIERPESEFEITNTYPVSSPDIWELITLSQIEKAKKGLRKLANSNSEINLYFHVPFCKSKCKYCFYYTIQGGAKSISRKYIKYINNEIDLKKRILGNGFGIIKSIYIGGGTPSFLEEIELKELFALIRKEFPNLTKDYTWTIEVSPDTITSDIFSIIKNSQINRISIGVESTDSKVLKVIGRLYNTADVFKSVNMILSNDFYLNVDLIYGLPQQTLESWMETVQQIATLRVPEITLYYLRINPKTLLSSKQDDFWYKEVMMFKEANEILEQEGYVQKRPHHWVINKEDYLTFWDNYKYAPVSDQRENSLIIGGRELGFGPSAITHIGNNIYLNAERIEKYYNLIRAGILPLNKIYHLKEIDRKKKFFIYGIQEMKIDTREYRKIFGEDLDKFFKSLLNFYEHLGLIEKAENSFNVTKLGTLFYDVMERSFIALGNSTIFEAIGRIV